MAEYGDGSSSFLAAGGEAGLVSLVDDFYQIMHTSTEASEILAMHRDLAQSKQRLAAFLAGWLGGPKLYRERYGSIHIPNAHSHMAIGQNERDQWISCMESAVQRQPWATDFKAYFCLQITVPADRILRVCAHGQPSHH